MSGEDLRRQAEAKWAARQETTPLPPATEPETRRLIHELEVRQIELEMQNDELRLARSELEAELRQLTPLHAILDISARKRAEAMQARLAAIVQDSDDAIYSKTLDGILLSWNAGAENLYGYSTAEAIGSPVSIIIPPDQPDELTSILERIGRGERIQHFETTRVRKDGARVLVSVTISPVRDASGQIAGAAAIARDITEHRQAEAQMRYAATLLAAMQDAVIGTDEQLRITAWNPAAEAVYGWQAGEVIGRSATDVLQTEFNDRPGVDARQLFLAAGEYRGEARQRHKNGSTIPIEYVVKILRDHSGHDIGRVSVNRDISERKRAEESLGESQARTESVLASVADVHVIFDRQWRYLYVNNVALETIGRPRENILGHTVWEIYPIIVGTELERAYRRAMDERLAAVFDFHYLAKGTWLEHRFYPAPEGLAVFTSDITERKRAETALRQANLQLRTLGERLSVVQEGERMALARELHDQVGQNLTALNLNLNIIRAQLPPGAAKQLDQRLADSLALVRETTARTREIMVELHPSLLDDYGLVAALRAHADRLAQRLNLAIVVTGDEPAPRLPAPVEMGLFRIAQEALNNVAKHSGASSASLALEKSTAGIRLTIADNGAGFDPSARPRPDSQPGSGLIIMRDRAKAFGGQFRLETSPGQGTRIVIELPG